MKGRPCNTSGNQKWQGASPILKASAILMDSMVTFLAGSKIDHDPVNQA